jgi:hypothetical protein
VAVTLQIYVVTAPLLVGTTGESHADTVVPPEPEKVQATVPVGATPPDPVTTTVKVITDPSDPVPEPLKTTVGVTCAITTVGDEAGLRAM